MPVHPYLGDPVPAGGLYVTAGRKMPTLAASLLVQARQRSRLSQQELARRAGTSRTAISAIEHGKRDPGLEHLSRLLAAAGFDLRIRIEEIESHDAVLREQGAALGDEASDRNAAMRHFYEEARAAMPASRPLRGG